VSTVYGNWYQSTWPTVSRGNSAWHFDNSKAPEPGVDSYTSVGRVQFPNNWQQQIDPASTTTAAWKRLIAATPDHELQHTLSQNLQDVGQDPEQGMFDTINISHLDVAHALAAQLGLQHSITRLHIQRPGQLLNIHIDDLAEVNQDPAEIRRFIVAVSDWCPGQVFQFGNAVWSQWRAGDCVTWSWKDIPHGSANFGWQDRPMIQITGYTTSLTQQLVSQANSEQLISL
jgi:hypothetical protein